MPEKQLIVEYFSGTLTLRALIELKNMESLDKRYNPNFNIIDDFRDTTIHFTKDDILGYINFVKQNAKIYGTRRSAFLTNTPNQVVHSSLFNILGTELPITVGIVSTVTEAAKWVGLVNNDHLIELIIKDIGYEIKV